jgi:hypothetical protein
MGKIITHQRLAYFKYSPSPYIPGQQEWLFTPKGKKEVCHLLEGTVDVQAKG